MYIILLIIFFIISISLITLIIIVPTKYNLTNYSINTNSIYNTIITSKFLKDTLNISIITCTILFYIFTIILNNINNNYKTYNIKNIFIKNKK